MKILTIQQTQDDTLKAISGGFNPDNANKPLNEFTFSEFLEVVADFVEGVSTDMNAVSSAYPWIQKYIDNPIEF